MTYTFINEYVLHVTHKIKRTGLAPRYPAALTNTNLHVTSTSNKAPRRSEFTELL